ncbi:MAG: alpha/beta hydrolase [Proteobacteria bacterium]|nr:alpha/beta hydrolase [Pseudomonadota bacterium]MBI3499880.1 alpha/beta hydrolase [Pseudomonadota bacterium]
MRDGGHATHGPGETVRLNYFDWGPRFHPTMLFCVHGLTRQGRDFDALAKGLARDYRIICPDVVGRGRSGWLNDKSGYNLETYIAHMIELIEHLGKEQVDWVGTSMGGLIGMRIAAERPEMIRRLVLNDIGPFLPKAVSQEIAEHVGEDPHFRTLTEVMEYLKRVHAEFGDLSDALWSEMTTHSVLRLPGGGYALHYDPEIRNQLRQSPIKDIDLWTVWDEIACPVLVLRGERSRVLLPETARDMARRGPRATVVEIPGVGHAPALMSADQIALIRDWLVPEEDREQKPES